MWNRASDNFSTCQDAWGMIFKRTPHAAENIMLTALRDAICVTSDNRHSSALLYRLCEDKGEVDHLHREFGKKLRE
jgi:hypothetical protein